MGARGGNLLILQVQIETYIKTSLKLFSLPGQHETTHWMVIALPSP